MPQVASGVSTALELAEPHLLLLFQAIHYHTHPRTQARMGTLTAGVERLAGHCDHKLPTSCQLTITECCACADERAHSASYSVYIDGVGFVPRGTRWQRYCWFCKEVSALARQPAERSLMETPRSSGRTESQQAVCYLLIRRYLRGRTRLCS